MAEKNADAGAAARNNTNAAKNNTQAKPPAYPPFLFRLTHWLVSGSVVVLALTGYSLHAVARPEWSRFGGVLPSWFWPGRVNLWHLVAAAVFAPAAIAMLWTCWRGRFWRRPTLVVLLIGSVAMAVSGWLKMNSFGSFTLYSVALSVHAVLGLVLMPIAFLWHTVYGLTVYWRQLIPTFHPWAKPQGLPVLGFIVLAAVTTCLVLRGLPVHPPWHTLHATPIDATDVELGELASLPWGDAPPLVIPLANGAGYPGGQTKVTLRAFHDGENLFVKAEWLDNDESRQYIPWRKVGGKWEHLRTGPAGGPRFDENDYYEDKFALLFPIGSDWQFDRFGCAASCHAGGGRAYGYTGTNRPIDVWHWKATRTDPVGQIDDKYWSQLDFESKDVGRHGDPKQSGGYSKNIAADNSHPAFLPDFITSVRHGMIPAEHAVEYTEAAAAQVRQGTIIPGIVASPFVGDRGDIQCASTHQRGRWTLYMRRKLDTGSQYDVKFVPGRSYAFGCAAFDHTSKRHAYNLVPYRLVLAR